MSKPYKVPKYNKKLIKALKDLYSGKKVPSKTQAKG